MLLEKFVRGDDLEQNKRRGSQRNLRATDGLRKSKY